MHLQLLTGHIQVHDLVGKYLLHNIDFLYLHIGLQEKIFTYNYSLVKDIAPASWITNTWRYASNLSATITTPSLSLEPQRIHDTTIMSHANKYYSEISRKRINAVRIVLRVFYTSDIKQSDGRQICQSYLYPLLKRGRSTSLQQPKEANPVPKAWAI